MMDNSVCEVLPQDFLCCGICNEEYRQPKYLPCFHTFCSACIKDYIAANVDESGSFGCPHCATEAILTAKEDPSDLPDNPLVRRLSASSSNASKEKYLCRVCQISGINRDAEHHCIECDDFLCVACVDSHAQEADTKHTLQTTEELKAKTESHSSVPNNQVLPRCCEEFDPMDIEAMFCVDCDKSVCSECHVSEHVDHRCAELAAVAANFENKICAPNEELILNSDILREGISKHEKNEQSLQKSQIELQSTVRKRSELLCDLVHQYESLLLDEIDRRHEKKIADIKQRKYEMEMQLSSINSLIDFTDKLFIYGSYEEKVFMRKKIGRRFRELCEESVAVEDADNLVMHLVEPEVTAETICDMFGGLGETSDAIESSNEIANSPRQPLMHQSSDSGHASDITENNLLSDVHDFNDTDYESEYLGSSNQSDTLKNVNFCEEVSETEYERENVYYLDNPQHEFQMPQGINKDCIKGIGINKQGDLVIGVVSMTEQSIHYVDKRGIIKGQLTVDNGRKIHSVSTDGKIALAVNRGDNRYKVKILQSDGSGNALAQCHMDSMGPTFITANSKGEILVLSNRYKRMSRKGREAKSGGNVSIYSQDGQLHKRITNDDFANRHLYLFEKPQHLCVDNRDNIIISDVGSHSVFAFDQQGELLFEYGNSDVDGIMYEGPEFVCVDAFGNVIVTDRKDKRIDVLSLQTGEYKHSLYMHEIPKFVAVSPDKQLMVASSDGMVKFYDYFL